MNSEKLPKQDNNSEKFLDELDDMEMPEAATSGTISRRKKRRRGLKSGPPELQESSDEEPAEIPKSEEASIDEESEPDEDFKEVYRHHRARGLLPFPKSTRPLGIETSRGEQKMQAELDELNILGTIEPEGFNNLEEEWEELEMAVDSGAAETVIGQEMLKAIKLI